MTSKELLYVEDALGHEQFLQTLCQNTSTELEDANLSAYLTQLQEQHSNIYNSFLNLL